MCKNKKERHTIYVRSFFRKDVIMRIGIDIGGSHVGVGLINKRSNPKY